MKNIFNGDGGAVFSYDYTKYGEYAEMIDYISYLRKNGWSLYKSDTSDYSSLTYYYKKNSNLLSVSYYPRYDEV